MVRSGRAETVPGAGGDVPDGGAAGVAQGVGGRPSFSGQGGAGYQRQPSLLNVMPMEAKWLRTVRSSVRKRLSVLNV